jgi:hypothetical protein
LIELSNDGIPTAADAIAWSVRPAEAYRQTEAEALRLSQDCYIAGFYRATTRRIQVG